MADRVEPPDIAAVPADETMFLDARLLATTPAPEDFEYFVTLDQIVSELGLLPVAGGHVDYSTVRVVTSEVNRPGLALTGFTDPFSPMRLQIIGLTETAYLSQLDAPTREVRLDAYFALGFPALIVTRGLHVMPDMVAAADRHDVPVLATDMPTSEFIAALNRFLIRELAPRELVGGSFVDVYGEGMLILGDSGLAKSEAALELVRRGHRLIADESVEVLRISDTALFARAPAGSKPMLHVHGLGDVDVSLLYGAGAVKSESDLSFVVQFEPRDLDKQYERLGLDEQYTSLLGVQTPLLTIPVQPGRNLAVILEVAAINQRQRKQGYNAAAALEARMLGGPGL
jgi:HPr kinase/phosphorylase